jgi:hypothetical protein
MARAETFRPVLETQRQLEMAQASDSRRGILYRVLTLIAVALIGWAFFSPAWWVSLTAPNYPEHTFPQGIRILFHMDSVQNGCQIRESVEVIETEALDCVHEMDTINHYVGMFPIASGGPVEKTFSPFLFAMLGVAAHGNIRGRIRRGRRVDDHGHVRR